MLSLAKLLTTKDQFDIENLKNKNITIFKKSLSNVNATFKYQDSPKIYNLNNIELVTLLIENKNYAIPVNKLDDFYIPNISAIYQIKYSLEKYFYDGHGGHDVDYLNKIIYFASNNQLDKNSKEFMKIIENLNPEDGYVISIEEINLVN